MIDPPPVADLLLALGGLPELVGQLLSGAGTDWGFRPQAGEWSLTEIACHVRDVELEVHQPRLQAILARDNPFLSGINADEWAGERRYDRQSGVDAAAAFIDARAQTLGLLLALPDDAWLREGQHSYFGSTTLQELVNLIVQHDRVHQRQIGELVTSSSRNG